MIIDLVFLSVILILFLSLFFSFFDPVRKCRNCGSRWKTTIRTFEVFTNSEKILIFENKYRRCLFCKNDILLKKKSRSKKRGKDKEITIRL
ncbi:MAG: hypothetical protein PHH17_02015 [Candidatus Pacebacteria bacterium]|jgi:hypothetical protein|nr:hypothetical protein [Candidatus Paceibacterota bacterium]MDD3072759.1 hypothetical protein [Candidatus Paceibacterota bacterium]MDD3729188.1 hypothetical protein [Candidatus Paceibacterota bacterium]MDD4201713.1 hypothetical protein [Candidatus Paceibacterota bacterium]MDD4467071.1 hypothetical protein [Candidatus Paceibacterota bacterium]